MGVEGIWGGTSWISLRSVHFLEVYIKPKKKKNPVAKSSKACQRCTVMRTCPQSKELLCEGFSGELILILMSLY